MIDDLNVSNYAWIGKEAFYSFWVLGCMVGCFLRLDTQS